jgi:transcriptional regulator with XRE-family HTH domain
MMLAKGLPLADIAEITGLSASEVAQLAAQGSMSP